MRAEPVERVEGRARGGLRLPAAEVGRVRERGSATISLDELRSARAGRASAFSTKRRSASSGGSVGACGDQRHRPLRHRERARPARRRAGEHEPVDALRVREGELLRDHPAEARADARARARRRPRRAPRRASPASWRGRVRARAARRSRRSRGCRSRTHPEARRASSSAPAPSRSGRSRGPGRAAAAARRRAPRRRSRRRRSSLRSRRSRARLRPPRSTSGPRASRRAREPAPRGRAARARRCRPAGSRRAG